MKNNYQLNDYILYKGKVRKINAVTNISLLIYDDRYGEGLDHVLWVRYDEVEPIPITPEWLELNEIHFDTKYSDLYSDPEFDFKFWFSNDHLLEVSNLSNSINKDFSAQIYRAHMDNEDHETIGCIDAQFVHQLQHLCRDCDYNFEPKFE